MYNLISVCPAVHVEILCVRLTLNEFFLTDETPVNLPNEAEMFLYLVGEQHLDCGHWCQPSIYATYV